jgi:hypothetical protein
MGRCSCTHGEEMEPAALQSQRSPLRSSRRLFPGR